MKQSKVGHSFKVDQSVVTSVWEKWAIESDSEADRNVLADLNALADPKDEMLRSFLNSPYPRSGTGNSKTKTSSFTASGTTVSGNPILWFRVEGYLSLRPSLCFGATRPFRV